jgi:hypothetical protein
MICGYPETSLNDFVDARLDKDVPEDELGKELREGNDGNEVMEEDEEAEVRPSDSEGGMVIVPLAKGVPGILWTCCRREAVC